MSRQTGIEKIAALMAKDDVLEALKIIDAATVTAAAKIEEAKTAARKVQVHALTVAAALASSNLNCIRAISATLRDPDLPYRIIDELPDGILLVDKNGLIQLVNKQTNGSLVRLYALRVERQSPQSPASGCRTRRTRTANAKVFR